MFELRELVLMRSSLRQVWSWLSHRTPCTNHPSNPSRMCSVHRTQAQDSCTCERMSWITRVGEGDTFLHKLARMHLFACVLRRCYRLLLYRLRLSFDDAIYVRQRGWRCRLGSQVQGGVFVGSRVSGSSRSQLHAALAPPIPSDRCASLCKVHCGLVVCAGVLPLQVGCE